jgi:glycerophosphoryl diester phosphodiesterase
MPQSKSMEFSKSPDVAMSSIDEMVDRPIAHRGLHDGHSIIENTPSAFAAAIAGRYGIECDLQITADGEAMVHHDDALGRLTHGGARLDAMTTAELKRIPFKASTDRMITLGELCDLAAGRSALFIELKSHFNRDQRLVNRTADVLSRYRGPAAVMSFDPVQMVALREIAPALLRGIVAESRAGRNHGRRDHAWAAARREFVYGEQVMRMRPQFVAYAVNDLPSVMIVVARKLFRLPILAWTVRNTIERQRAERHADQMIFEGFRP